MIIPRRFLNRFSRTPKPPTAASPPPKAVFLSLSFHVLFRFSAAAQASLHRPAPRTRSRATLIPLLRPLDRRKGLLSHISPVSSTALILILRYLRFTSATPAFCDRSPFLRRRADFLCRRSTFLCRRVSPGEAAPKGATGRGDPTASVRSTLRLAPTADHIRPFRRRKLARPAAPFCHHSPTRLRPLPDPPLTIAKSGGNHRPTLASKRPCITRFQSLDNPWHVHSNPGTVS